MIVIKFTVDKLKDWTQIETRHKEYAAHFQERNFPQWRNILLWTDTISIKLVKTINSPRMFGSSHDPYSKNQ